jgi:hypothetical protein
MELYDFHYAQVLAS